MSTYIIIFMIIVVGLQAFVAYWTWHKNKQVVKATEACTKGQAGGRT